MTNAFMDKLLDVVEANNFGPPCNDDRIIRGEIAKPKKSDYEYEQIKKSFGIK